MKEKILDRLCSVKSIVTLIMVIVFSVLAFMGKVPAEDVKYFVTMVMVFYFSAQRDKSGGE